MYLFVPFLPSLPFISPRHDLKPPVFTWKSGGGGGAFLIQSRPHLFFRNCSHMSFSFPLLFHRRTIRKAQMGGTIPWSHPWLRLPSQFVSLTVSAPASICWNRCLLILTACCLPQSVGQQVTNAHIPMRTHGHALAHKHRHICTVVTVRRVCLTY